MIYVDEQGHLITDGFIEELHRFAQKLGFKRSWFQDKAKYPHYDCTTPNAIRRAVAAGAQLIDARETVKILRGE